MQSTQSRPQNRPKRLRIARAAGSLTPADAVILGVKTLYAFCCSRWSTTSAMPAGSRMERALAGTSARRARAARRCVVASEASSATASLSSGESRPDKIFLRVSPCRCATSSGMKVELCDACAWVPRRIVARPSALPTWTAACSAASESVTCTHSSPSRSSAPAVRSQYDMTSLRSAGCITSRLSSRASSSCSIRRAVRPYLA
mmetsp:Transcript_22367/g.47160  ORF Transcript_22367/g.47160 Transcript_22367/m.47160 type:complete len:203 (-) Transcript_22367:745-1353(-)